MTYYFSILAATLPSHPLIITIPLPTIDTKMTDADPTTFDSQQRQAYEKRMKLEGLAKGFVGGSALGLGFNMIVKRMIPVAYKSPTIRVALMIIPLAGLSKVGMEQEYRHAILRERGVYQIAEKEKAYATGIDYSRMSVKDKVFAFSKEHRLSLLLGAWLGSMGVAGYMVSRDKLMTSSQKVVQAR